jgi:holliday junction resolvase Hjr
MTFYSKGANFERSLVNKFWENGFAAIRAAGSGSAPQPIPDVTAIRGSRVIILECKTTSKDSFRLDKSDVDKLRIFLDRADCEAYIAVKFDREKPRFFPLNLLATKKISKKDTSISFETLLGVQKTL